jgi:hypothetical protein
MDAILSIIPSMKAKILLVKPLYFDLWLSNFHDFVKDNLPFVKVLVIFIDGLFVYVHLETYSLWVCIEMSQILNVLIVVGQEFATCKLIFKEKFSMVHPVSFSFVEN